MAENSGGFLGTIEKLAGFYKDVQVAKESGNGQAAPNVRPESIADQSAMGRDNQSGPDFNNQRIAGTANVLGVPMDTRILTVTGLFLAGAFVIKKLG